MLNKKSIFYQYLRREGDGIDIFFFKNRITFTICAICYINTILGGRTNILDPSLCPQRVLHPVANHKFCRFHRTPPTIKNKIIYVATYIAISPQNIQFFFHGHITTDNTSKIPIIQSIFGWMKAV